MIILFSPSESKKSGGDAATFSAESFLFPELYMQRMQAIEAYNRFVATADDSALGKLFGIKKAELIAGYKKDIFTQKSMKAIERYDGVAFEYLDYAGLSKAAQRYIDTHTLIFSNLFGPIMAGDVGLPEYKLKQGEKVGEFALEAHYKKYFSKALDAMLEKEPFLDLRAGFYNKFYKPISPYVTLKFLKNGKVVSHWAKAYRGIVLRHLAQNNIESMDAFMKMEMEGLAVHEILSKGIHTEIVYDLL